VAIRALIWQAYGCDMAFGSFYIDKT